MRSLCLHGLLGLFGSPQIFPRFPRCLRYPSPLGASTLQDGKLHESSPVAVQGIFCNASNTSDGWYMANLPTHSGQIRASSTEVTPVSSYSRVCPNIFHYMAGTRRGPIHQTPHQQNRGLSKERRKSFGDHQATHVDAKPRGEEAPNVLGFWFQFVLIVVFGSRNLTYWVLGPAGQQLGRWKLEESTLSI